MTKASTRRPISALTACSMAVFGLASCRNSIARTCAEGVCFELTGEIRAANDGHKHSYHIAGRGGWLDVQSFDLTPPTRETLDEGAALLVRRYENIEATNIHTARTTLGGQAAAIVDADRWWHAKLYRRRTWLMLVQHRWIAIDVTAPAPEFENAIALFRASIASLTLAQL